MAIKDAGAKPVIFGTWPRHPTEAIYKGRVYKNHAPPRTPHEMLYRVDGALKDAARKIGAEIVLTGKYWLQIEGYHPNFSLYEPDGNHATIHGSYLTALLFYKHFSKIKDLSVIKFVPNGITIQEAEFIKKIASQNIYPRY